MSVKKSELLLGEDVVDVWETGAGPELEPEQTDAEKKTDAMREALQVDADAFISVSRQTMGGNSPMEFINRFPADKFDFGQLQAYLMTNYGGGDYRCKLYAKGKIVANRLLTIATAKTPDSTKPSDMGEIGNMFTQVLARMDNQNRQFMEMMQAQQGGGNNRTELLNEMMVMKQLFAPPESANSGGGTMLAQMRDLMSFQSEMGLVMGTGAKDDDDAGFGDLLEKITPLLEVAVGANKGEATPPPKQPQPTPQQKAAKNMSMMLRMGIGQLLKGAAKNSDPYGYAEMVIDNIPEAAVQKFVIAPDALKQLIKVNKNVEQFAPWFILLGEHVKAQMGLPSTVSNLYDDDESTGFDLSDEGLTGEVISGSVAENATDTDPPKDVTT